MFPSIDFNRIFYCKRKSAVSGNEYLEVRDVWINLIVAIIVITPFLIILFFVAYLPIHTENVHNAYYAKRYVYKNGQQGNCYEIGNWNNNTSFWTKCTINYRIDYTHYDTTYTGWNGKQYTTPLATENIRPQQKRR